MHQRAQTSPVKLFWKRLSVITLGSLLSLLSLEANSYWDPPVSLTPSNPWVANFTRNPTLIYADPQGQTLTLDWAAHGHTWLWDGNQWHYQGRSGSLTINQFTIIGMVPTSFIMYYDATLGTAPACVPATCQSLGRQCGSVSDGCGGTLNCGTCSGGLSCGGGGTPGVCGTTPAACTPGSWNLNTVDTAGDVGRRSAIAVDPVGRIHVVYYDVDNHRLKHATRAPGGNWQFDTVEQATNFEDYAETALALDSAGGLHVSYQQRFITGGEDLRYAYRSPTTGWSPPETVEAGGRTGFGTDIVVDGNGGLHLSYHRLQPDQILYRYRPPGSSWQGPETVGSGYGDSALAREPNGAIHFSYSNGNNLFYRLREPGGNWRAPESAFNIGQIANRDLARDTQGGVHITFQAGSSLNHAYRSPGMPPTGGQWSLQNLDNSGSLGPYMVMDVDAQDRLHIAYRDYGNDDLKYVGSTVQGSWNNPMVLDSQGQVANYGIGIDFTAGQAYISYFDWSNGDLKVAIGCP